MAEQLVRLDQRAKTISKLFEVNQKRMLAAAPRTTGDPMRIFQICFNMIAYNGDLLACTQQSLVGGVFEALKLGIALGGPMQEGWLIPFKNQATLIVGYMGYRNIIDRAGSVIDMHPSAVHNGKYLEGKTWVTRTPDEFDYWKGDQPRIIHKPRNPDPTKEEQLVAVYCVANLRRGGRQTEVLLTDEVNHHRSLSRAASRGPWVDHYVPMALKTSVRKLAKYLPKSNELLARALDLDEKADRGVNQEFDTPIDITYIDAEDAPKTPTASPMDRLKERLGVAKDEPGGPSESELEEIRRQDRETADREGQ